MTQQKTACLDHAVFYLQNHFCCFQLSTTNSSYSALLLQLPLQSYNTRCLLVHQAGELKFRPVQMWPCPLTVLS
jgi:hypothetical protein